jgi:hypothetical protein
MRKREIKTEEMRTCLDSAICKKAHAFHQYGVQSRKGEKKRRGEEKEERERGKESNKRGRKVYLFGQCHLQEGPCLPSI